MPTATRTPDEILARYEAQKPGDVFGFAAEVLIAHLPFSHARPFLKDGVTEDQWEPLPMDPAALLAELTDYLDFAWGKARDHRGLSADRSVQKLRELAWLCGHDQAIAAMDAAPYAQYGAPKLAALAESLELAVPEGDDLARMVKGDPCSSDCYEGCGR